MERTNHPKKQPERVRERLLEEAGKLVAEHGLKGFTLDQAARAAEVSKGGLLHHFPSKQALVEALFEDMLGRFSRGMARVAAADPDPAGRFTRAYLLADTEANENMGPVEKKLSGILTMAMGNDPGLRRRWREWMAEQTAAHGNGGNAGNGGDEAEAIDLWIVRYAADGLWAAALNGYPEHAPEVKKRIIERLVELTHWKQ